MSGGRVRCPMCDRDISLRLDGRLQAHVAEHGRRGEAHYVLLPLAVADDSQGSARTNPDNPVDNPSQGSARTNPKPEVKGSESSSQGSESGLQGSAISALPAEMPYNPQNPHVNQPSSLTRALGSLAAAVPDLTEREISAISRKLESNPAIPHPAAYVRTVVGNGDAAEWAASMLNGSGRNGRQAETDEQFTRAMERARSPRSQICRHSGHKPQECAYGGDWCTCSCHRSTRQEQAGEPQLLGELVRQAAANGTAP